MTATLTIDGQPIIQLPADKPWSIAFKPETNPKPPDAISQRLSVKGVVCFGSDDPIKAKPTLNDCGLTGLRWWGTTRFRGAVDSVFAKQAQAWKQATPVKRIGITFTLPLNSPASEIPNTTQVKDWAKSVRDTLAGAIDFVQIINEANLQKYWPGTIQQAADVCHVVAGQLLGSPIQVYAPSISEVVGKFDDLVKTGIGSVVSAFDVHPYGAQSTEFLQRLKAMATLAGDEKLVCTEFGLHSGSFNGWRVEIAKAWDGLKPLLHEAYCYRLIAKLPQPGEDPLAGKFGMVMPDSWLQNTETYPTWKAMKV